MLILLGCLVAVLLCLPGGYVDTLNFNIKQTGSDSTLRVRTLCFATPSLQSAGRCKLFARGRYAR